MSQVIGDGGNALELTIPTRVDNNWDAIMQLVLAAISTHNHDGAANGATIAIVNGTVTNAMLATMAANTIKANGTGSTASPTDFPFVSTATANSAVRRDSSGNFAATTITAALTGAASGNLSLASPSQHGLLLSGTANATTALAAAGTNNFLVGSSGADPAWNTPTQATALLNNVTQSLAGLVASAGQLLGTNTNDSASAGRVGELLGPISRLKSNATSLTSPNALNVATTTSITLTAGDWDVRGAVGFLTGTSTSVTKLIAAISKTSGTLPASDTTAVPTAGEVIVTTEGAANVSTGQDTVLTIPTYRVTVATTQAIFLVAAATFSASTLTCYGSLEARRIR